MYCTRVGCVVVSYRLHRNQANRFVCSLARETKYNVCSADFCPTVISGGLAFRVNILVHLFGFL